MSINCGGCSMKEKKRKNSKSLFIQIILLICSILLVGLIKQEILVTISLLVFLIISFFLEYHKGEWGLFFTGIIVGIALELGGDLIFPLQSWESGLFFGIPLWLPILWGYAFVFIRRIGKLIVKD